MKKKLTFANFMRWYSNLPVPNRSNIHTYFINGHASTISPHAVYEILNEEEDKRREAQVEIDRLLKIAEQFIK